LGYLHDEPVQACPPSAWYRFRKFARRNKRALATLTLLGLMLMTALVTLTLSLVAVNRQKERTGEALTAEQQAHEEETRRREQARNALDAMNSVMSLLLMLVLLLLLCFVLFLGRFCEINPESVASTDIDLAGPVDFTTTLHPLRLDLIGVTGAGSDRR
jgi:small-conductance mechanosensitive channel